MDARPVGGQSGPEDRRDTTRLFVAAEVPVSIQAQLGAMVGMLRGCVRRGAVRWVRSENIHLTLRFVGEVPIREIPALTSALRSAVHGLPPFGLHLDKAGCFPTEREPRVLWVGLGGGLDGLLQVQERIERGTAEWGRVEPRPFHPHLTLGRVVTRRREEMRRVGELMRGAPLPECGGWTVRAVDLIQSVLAPGGSRYTELATIPLGDPT